MSPTEDDLFADLELVPPNSDPSWVDSRPAHAARENPQPAASVQSGYGASPVGGNAGGLLPVPEADDFIEVDFEDLEPPELTADDEGTQPYFFADRIPAAQQQPPSQQPSVLSLANAAEATASTVGEAPAKALPGAEEIVRQATPRENPLVEMEERFALGDYSGALLVGEAILEEDSTNAVAQSYVVSCRDMLAKMYIARIGPLDRAPVVLVPPGQLKWLSLDHRAGFVLALVDGMSSLEVILDLSGMSQLDTLRILYELAAQNVIGFR